MVSVEIFSSPPFFLFLERGGGRRKIILYHLQQMNRYFSFNYSYKPLV